MNNNQTLPLELIAIDLDGTLVDSVGDLHSAVVRMQGDMGLEPATIAAVRHWVGNGIERLVHRALTGSMESDATPEVFERAIDRFRIAYDQTNGTVSTLYPGVLQGLDWLTTLHVPMVCITNKAGQYSRPLLEALDIARYFHHHLAGDEVAAKKPDPAALLEAMRLCNANASNSVMIGDSLSDIRAARAAGFTMISVSYGYNHGISVRELTGNDQSDAVIDSFSELPACLPKLIAEYPPRIADHESKSNP